MLGAFLAFAGVFVYAVQLEKGNVGPSDMRLPQQAGALGRPVIQGAGAANPLTIQHMGSREVGMRLTEIIAESLAFDKGNYKAAVARAAKNFTPAGYAQYLQFLTNSQFESSVTSGDLQAGAFVEGEPIELGRGVYDGAYKWVFEIPVTISLIPRNSETYRNDETKPQNHAFVLRAQMARVKDAQDPNAVKIELWQVLPPRVRK